MKRAQILLFTAFLMSSVGAQTLQYHQPSGSTQVSFSLSEIRSNAVSDTSKFDIFINFQNGDIGKIEDVNNEEITFTYDYGSNPDSQILSSVYVELTEIYVETDLPFTNRVYASNSSGSGEWGDNITNVTIISSQGLFTNRGAVARDMISFIIRPNINCDEYDCFPATLTFNFEDDQLEYDGLQSMGYNNTSNLTLIDESNNYLEFQLMNRNNTTIVIPMKVKEIVENTNINVSYQIIYDSSCNCPPPVIPAFTGLRVTNSHDPNQLYANLSNICMSSVGINEPEKVIYKIIYQNLGSGPADLVTINIPIPDYFQAANLKNIRIIYPEYIPAHHTNKDDVQTRLKISNTSFVDPNKPIQFCTLNNNILTCEIYGPLLRKGKGLRGLKETNQPLPLEEETIDYLEFELDKKTNKQLGSCQSIVMQAEIIFDCNYPIKTNPVFIDKGCDSSIYKCNCVEKEFKSESLSLTDALNGKMYIPENLLIDPETTVDGQWYPMGNKVSNLDDLAINNYGFIKSEDVYLVFSLTNKDLGILCHKYKIHFPVRRSCNLDIKTEVCQNKDGYYNIKAYPIGNTSGSLRWQDCINDSERIYCKEGLTEGEIYLSLVDEPTGCFVEKWVQLNQNNVTVKCAQTRPGSGCNASSRSGDCAVGVLLFIWMFRRVNRRKLYKHEDFS